MAITQSVCNVWRYDLLRGLHDMTVGTSQTFRCALYTSTATIGPTTDTYTATGEISGTGYVAKGAALSIAQLYGGADKEVAFVDFSDASWAGATFTARGALIFNDSLAGDNAICVLDFGSDKSVSSGTFTVVFPPATENDAILQLA